MTDKSQYIYESGDTTEWENKVKAAGSAIARHDDEIIELYGLVGETPGGNPDSFDLKRYATTNGTATAYTITFSPAFTSQPAGLRFRLNLHTAAGVDPTLQVDALTPLPLINRRGGPANGISGLVEVWCDGSNYVVMTERAHQILATVSGSYALKAGDLAPIVTVPLDISAGDAEVTELALGSMSGIVEYVIVADDGANTSTRKAQVLDSASGEVWTGVREGDFFRIAYDGTNRRVLGHLESFFAHVFVSSDETVIAGAAEQIVNDSLKIHWGDWWNTANSEGTLPFDCWIDVLWQILQYGGRETTATAKLNTTFVRDPTDNISGAGSTVKHLPTLAARVPGDSGQTFQLWAVATDSSGGDSLLMGDAGGDESFAIIKLTRRY